LQATNSKTTHGVHIFGGSTLKLRDSITGGNHLDGVFVTTFNGATKNDDVSHIDLGDLASATTTAGGNTLQYATGGAFNPNLGVGVCLNLTANAGQTLAAIGNTFEAANCATTAAALKVSNNCTGGGDVGVTGKNTTNKIAVNTCTCNGSTSCN
jgi:hypothetical protein